MPAEQRDPTVCNSSDNMGGKGEMIKEPISFAGPETEDICQGEG